MTQKAKTHQSYAAGKDDDEDEVLKGLVFCELVDCGPHLHPPHHVRRVIVQTGTDTAEINKYSGY